MNQKILHPDFSLREPNINSTRIKNQKGLCCFHTCNNKLPKEEYYYMGFLACKECGEKLQEEVKKMQNDSMEGFIKYISDAINGDKNETK